jgi:D-cysteine desulfhydrase family pyridoxal phosphate-dependent enzyme
MNRLGQHLGMKKDSLWIKRDDQTGLALGGNKARKLEYLCAEAIDNRAQVLVTGGGPQSNHCRMTAAAAKKLGLECRLILAGSEPKQLSGNTLLYELFGAEMIWVGEEEDGLDLDREIRAHCESLEKEGRRAAVIPVGGSVPRGALGYVRAAFELLDQNSDFEQVVLATGSCGTHAGMVAGLGDFERVLGVRVGERPNMEERVTELANATAELAELTPPKGRCKIEHGVLGEGYGAVTESGLEAIDLAARLEGVILDPVYTGKAMAGLIESVRSGRIAADSPTVFLHTGGAPALFAAKYQGELVYKRRS